MKPAEPPPEFWVCRACGTPNPRAAYLTMCVRCGEGATPPAPIRPRQGLRIGRWVGAAAWSYFVAVVGLVLALRWLGDRWWPGVLLLYAPRWPFAMPLALLIPAALACRRRALVPLALSAILMVGPVLGFCVPWSRLVGPHGKGPRLRILSCNVQSGRWDPERLEALVRDTDPDLLLLQEWTDKPGAPASWSEGRHVRRDGGLYLSSRYPIRGVEVLADPVAPWRKLAVRYAVELPTGMFKVVNVHLETPRKGIEPLLAGEADGIFDLRLNLAFRENESETIARWVARSGGRVLIAGDFNMPADSVIFGRQWSSYRDAFSEAGWGFGYTKFTRWHGIRIDHILIAPGLRCRRSWVGPDVGSDHRPLLADLSSMVEDEGR